MAGSTKHGSGRPDHEQSARNARRDLARMDEQSEKILGASTPDTRDGEYDWAEVWGSRIGRTLGVLFAAYLVYYLITHFFAR